MATTTAEQKVTLGGQEFTIQRFRGLKAILALAAMTRIAREVPDMLADAVKSYQRRNTVVVTEAMSRLPRWEGFTKEDFDAAAKANGGVREIELPAVMTQQEQVLAALPDLLENARTEVIRLFSILLIPNEELKQADKEDRVEGTLDRYQDLLLYEAELDELAGLAIAASDVLSEQLADRKERLGKLTGGLMKMLRVQPRSQVPSLTSPPSTEETTVESPSTPSTSTDDVPTSSTPSQAPTTGTERPLSTVSPGSSS